MFKKLNTLISSQSEDSPKTTKEETAKIEVNSSNFDDIYTIKISVSPKKSYIRCNCQAGENGMICKHIKAAMSGDAVMLNSNKSSWDAWQILLLQFLEQRPEIAELNDKIIALEKNISQAQAQLKKVKSEMSAVILGL